jgi:hypothetical protein
MSHNVGRIVSVAATRIGPDSGTGPNPAGTWEYTFTPQAALVGGPPRFVILHLSALDLPGASRVEVDLGYGQDVFTAGPETDAWTRPIDPNGGPINIRFVGPGPNGGVTLAEYGSGEPSWPTTYPTTPEDLSYLNSVTNADLFLQTDPYAEPTYQTWLRCGGSFDWRNAACLAAGSTEAETARAVCMIVALHFHGSERLLSTCTGTLIDTNLVLTALHCLNHPDGDDIRSASVTFGYQTTCAGGRPAGYSPMFHKVRGRRAVAARGSNDADWLILEIDPPPSGVTPRPLRSTVLGANESVFTVHHPNGTVKKTQAGVLAGGDVHIVSGFDYGGGSSGSALFDSAGRVIGASLWFPLGPGPDQCGVHYTSSRAVLDGLAAPPAPPTPLDVMIVIDRSGSMSLPGTAGTGRTKMDEARDAASLFVQLVRTGAGDRVGMVSFSTSATSPPETAPALVTAAQKQALVGPSPFTGGTIGALAAGGLTSIGGGIGAALQAVGTTTNQRAILLLTDGLQNTPPLVEDVEAQLGDTQLCVVGFGNEWNLDGALLNRVARDHGGLYTRASDGLALKKFFALCFGNIFSANMLTDPELRVPANDLYAPDLSVDVCDESRLTAIVGWNAPGEDLDVSFVAPGGATVNAGSPGVSSERGRTWAFLRVPLPFGGERNGTWKLRVSRAIYGELADISNEIRYFVSVLAEGGPTFEALLPERRLYTGDRLNPRVLLRYDDQTAPHADVEVAIQGPGISLGQLVAERGLVTSDPQGDVIDPFRATLQQIADESGGQVDLQPTRVTAPLYDDGVHDDGGMEADGIYGNPLDDLLRFEGAYDLHAVATYDEDCAGRREVMWSLHVDPGIDSATTDVRVVGAGVGTGTIRLTPRDRYGNPLGPGRGTLFAVAAQPGTQITGPVSDNGDGSYVVPVDWTPSAPRVPALIVSQPERTPVVIVPPGAQPGPLAGCLTWILVALVILLLVLLLVLLLW